VVADPVVVITGSSSGIGRAIAVKFATMGYHVIVHGFQNHVGLAETLGQITDGLTESGEDSFSPSGSRKIGMLADISDTADCQRLVEEAFAWKGRVDVWVNAAGADVLTGKAGKLSFDAKFDLLWRTDVAGTVRLSRLVGDRMLQQLKTDDLIRSQLRTTESKSCTTRVLPFITNLSWDQSEHGMEGESGQYFAATKSAIAAFSKSLAKTLAPHVRVNCVAPGWIKTDWGQQASPDWDARARGESMLNRWGSPEDVANVIYALASNGCEFINGQTIPVNGGWQPGFPLSHKS